MARRDGADGRGCGGSRPEHGDLDMIFFRITVLKIVVGGSSRPSNFYIDDFSP